MRIYRLWAVPAPGFNVQDVDNAVTRVLGLYHEAIPVLGEAPEHENQYVTDFRIDRGNLYVIKDLPKDLRDCKEIRSIYIRKWYYGAKKRFFID